MIWNGPASLMFAGLLAVALGGFVLSRRAGWPPLRFLARLMATLALFIGVTVAPYGLGVCHPSVQEGAVCPLLPLGFAHAAQGLSLFGLVALVTAFPTLLGLTALAALFARFRRP